MPLAASLQRGLVGERSGGASGDDSHDSTRVDSWGSRGVHCRFSVLISKIDMVIMASEPLPIFPYCRMSLTMSVAAVCCLPTYATRGPESVALHHHTAHLAAPTTVRNERE